MTFDVSISGQEERYLYDEVDLGTLMTRLIVSNIE